MILKINYYTNNHGEIIFKKISEVKVIKKSNIFINHEPYLRIYRRRCYKPDYNSVLQHVYLFNTHIDCNRYFNDKTYLFLVNMVKPYIREILMDNILK